MGKSRDTNASLEPSFVPRFRAEVAFVPVADEALLYVEETGELHQLDAIGALICRMFDGATSIEGAARELAAAFDAPREQVAADVLAFAERLAGYGLLEGIRPVSGVADGTADGGDAAADTEVAHGRT